MRWRCKTPLAPLWAATKMLASLARHTDRLYAAGRRAPAALLYITHSRNETAHHADCSSFIYALN